MAEEKTGLKKTTLIGKTFNKSAPEKRRRSTISTTFSAKQKIGRMGCKPYNLLRRKKHKRVIEIQGKT